jgi:acetyltransferase-like isoleucine patch superfamily enzyme
VPRLKFLLGVLVALLPSWLKIPLYRIVYRYEIGKGVHIGFSPFVRVRRCRIDDHTRIGHLNLFYAIEELAIGNHTRIGFLNLFRGGRISVGAYATVIRQNVFNSILEPDAVNAVDSSLVLGTGVVVASGHWLDFTDRITVGAHTIIGGRNSSFWTHNRQRTRGIEVGAHCYLGSEIRLAPGVEIAPLSIVAIGSVLVGLYQQPRSLVGGNPAAVVRPLKERDLFLVCRKTRDDIPDDISLSDLPEAVRDILRKQGPEGEHNGCEAIPPCPGTPIPSA